jgi:hypothetical protein
MNFGSTEILLIVFVVVAFFLVPMIFFLLAQQNTLRAVSAHNRKMQPGEVWLQLIPLFGLVWKFIVVTRISQSIRSEISRNSNSFGRSKPCLRFSSTSTYSIGLYGFHTSIGWFATMAGLFADTDCSV